MIHKLKWLFPLLFAAAAMASARTATQPPLEFTPETGFRGESEGRGTLKMLFGAPRSFHVISRGTGHADGTFRLDQTVTFAGEAPQARFWIMTRTAADRYSATLSDAAGPVTATTSGSRLSLRYRVKGPVVMHQELTLSADGRTIDNAGLLRVLGIPIGRLQETITRTVPATPVPALPVSPRGAHQDENATAR